MDVIWVTQAQYVDDYRVRVVFNDGAWGVVDLSDLVAGESPFAPLQDVEVFRSFALDGWSLTWLDGRLDIAPEFLYEHLEEDFYSADSVAEPPIAWNE